MTEKKNNQKEDANVGSNALLGCPFCGKSNLVTKQLNDHCSSVVCYFCGARGPLMKTRSAAQNSWNTRKPNV